MASWWNAPFWQRSPQTSATSTPPLRPCHALWQKKQLQTAVMQQPHSILSRLLGRLSVHRCVLHMLTLFTQIISRSCVSLLRYSGLTLPVPLSKMELSCCRYSLCMAIDTLPVYILPWLHTLVTLLFTAISVDTIVVTVQSQQQVDGTQI